MVQFWERRDTKQRASRKGSTKVMKILLFLSGINLHNTVYTVYEVT